MSNSINTENASKALFNGTNNLTPLTTHNTSIVQLINYNIDHFIEVVGVKATGVLCVVGIIGNIIAFCVLKRKCFR